MEKLKLSKEEIDTSMALDFIKKMNEFIEWPDHGEFIVIEQPNTITKHTTVTFKGTSDPFKSQRQTDTVHSGRKLAKKLEENIEMFVQLEYLARGTDARDVRDGHVKLMSQMVRCSDALWNCFFFQQYAVFPFNETTPLYVLGLAVAHAMHCNKGSNPIILIQHKSLVPLCMFFAQLCHDCNGYIIPLLYGNVNHNQLDGVVLDLESVEVAGCSGVIAEWADLDSAIDVFIDSSVTAPWRLKQMYVQESIFEEFKGALAARTRKPAENGRFVVRNKAFLIECLVPTATSGHNTVIHVQAYRTTKELLSLLQTPYLSVWAADAALSNEIALNSTALTVWINEYGSFEGPPRAALPQIYNLRSTESFKKVELKEISNTWAKMQTAERLEVIIAAIKASEEDGVKELLPELALEWRSGDLMHVTDTKICFGVQKQMDFISMVDASDNTDLLRVIKSLIYGNGVANWSTGYETFINELQKMNVPIVIFDLITNADSNSKDLISVKVPILLEGLKVIRTNYGTIFAN